MTTQTPAQQAEAFREEIRAAFDRLQFQINDVHMQAEEIRADLAQMREGLTHAAQPAPAPINGTYTEMVIDSIIMTYSDKGEPAYKAIGQPYNKFGVRVWPETLPTLGIDPASLKPGPNPQPAPIKASVLMQVNEEGKASPRKITGKA